MKDTVRQEGVGASEDPPSRDRVRTRERKFTREDEPTEKRDEAVSLYYAGLSYRRVKQVVSRSYEAVRQSYHRLAHLFDPGPGYHATVAVIETKVSVENDDVYVWAAVDVGTFEIVHIEVSPGRTDLDAVLFLEIVLKCVETSQ